MSRSNPVHPAAPAPLGGRHLALFGLLGLLAAVPAGSAQAPAAAPAPAAATGTLRQPSGSALIPDRFLRRWDPVTLFLDAPQGPGVPGPEDRPERWVTLSPAHPGAWQWLDARTLQFRPAGPWPALTRFTWTLTGAVGGASHTLATLMEAPTETSPSQGSEHQDPVDAVTLTFAEPLDPAALARMARVELRPLPGLDPDQARWLGAADFTVKTLERTGPGDQASYVLQFAEPIAGGQRAAVHLQLALDETDPRAFKTVTFSSGEPFRIKGAGCGKHWEYTPITPQGVHYTPEQAVRCQPERQNLTLGFTAKPRELGLVEVRNLVRFTPAVPDLAFTTSGRELTVTGSFRPNTLYRVDLVPQPIQDEQGRTLDMQGDSTLYLYFTPKSSFLKWQPSRAVVERHGPQMLPIEGRGFDRLDLRVYPVDPLERAFWPFPNGPVVVDEGQRPPGPGEEPAPFAAADAYVSPEDLASRLHALGSPPVSALVDLPLRREAGAARLGLDLAPHLRRIAGKDAAPGTYLVGMRRLDGSTERAWIRVQVTDLSLTTVEEPGAVRFAVTSLATGRPLAGAQILVEGAQSTEKTSPRWETFFSGSTDGQGQLAWKAPGNGHNFRNVRRIQVRLGDDLLVLDPTAAPERFADNRWRRSDLHWLQWAFEPLEERFPKPERLCHLFTERPVYRPEDKVHIKGYLRTRIGGELAVSRRPVHLVVEGPNDLTWRFPVQVTESGSLYHLFDEKTEPTGPYKVYLQEQDGSRCGELEILKDAYRIPTFEVQLQTQDPVPLDRPFDVQLQARYYAGGMLAKAPVRWRVAQFPYTWAPAKREGFIYSSEARFSRQGRFQSVPVLEREGSTDEDGAAVLGLDPGNATSAEPRSYAIEATVTGKDDLTVTNTRRVNAVPALVLGVKVPRYLERAREVTPEVIVVGPDGALKAGEKVTLRLAKREWHSHLQVGDFTQGEAKYVTEVSERKLLEQTLTSTAEPLARPLALEGAGVYLLELEAHDLLGRAQTLSVDFYVGGDEAQTWSRPPPQKLNATADRPSYVPGDTAHIVLESPFQQAHVLAVIEAPEGVRYQWVGIRNGAATFDLLIQKNFVPRVPVHFVLMRGRNGAAAPAADARLDLGRPTTLAATTWLQVEPVEHQLQVELEYREKAKPGDQVPVTLRLKDRQGRPVTGEVTLWLVDKAVMALGKERPLDPVPDFITRVRSRIGIIDTRNFTLGWIPFEERPGGDGPEEGEWFDKVTVRKRFDPVPYFNPAILVGPSGEARVSVPLPDDLTTFKVRAKAVSGPDRFGFAVGEIQVRLPVLAQPALPRFLRPGDRFSAAGLARVVEGEGGTARAHLKVEGATLEGPAERTFQLDPLVAQRLDFPVQVPTPGYTETGQPALTEAAFTLAVERVADQARDAFTARVPIRPDRGAESRRDLYTLAPGAAQALPALAEPARPGTLSRELLLSSQPGLVRMAGALSYLLDYPHGCTEQRLSKARAALAARRFQGLVGAPGSAADPERLVKAFLDALPGAVDGNGLVGYWPGSDGRVSLTAWTLELLVEARGAGLSVDTALFDRLVETLKQALRSDYAHFIDGEAYAERVMALRALAAAGQADTAYAAELARRADALSLEALARVTQVLARHQDGAPATLQDLERRLWDGLVFRLYQGREVYGGLQDRNASRNGLILPSETRTLAELVRALTVIAPHSPRLQVLVDALVALGQADGWGDTQANAAATLALSELLGSAEADGVSARLTQGGRAVEVSAPGPIARAALSDAGAAEITLAADAPQPLAVRLTSRFVPAPEGSQVEPAATGLVVRREALCLDPAGAAPTRVPLERGGQTLALKVGDLVEEHLELINPEDRHYLALVVPLAAGLEPLNPRLATAPAQAAPAGRLTQEPSYSAYLDDRVAFYYDSLPKGTYHFYFRTRAATAGSFIQPSAQAELMYDQSVAGRSAGARVEVRP